MRRPTTIFLGPRPSLVTLWCSINRKEDDGTYQVSIINGGTDGTFYSQTNEFRFGTDSRTHEMHMLWEGQVPEEHSGHYNDAIAWLHTQLAIPAVTPVLTEGDRQALSAEGPGRIREHDGESFKLVLPEPIREQWGADVQKWLDHHAREAAQAWPRIVHLTEVHGISYRSEADLKAFIAAMQVTP